MSLGLRQINIFDYNDYRLFLSDFYKIKKSYNPTFSYRSFATRAGLSSPSHFQMIVKGQRNISHKTVPKFIRALGLKGKERRYFEALTIYSQCQDLAMKSRYFTELVKLKQGVRLNGLDIQKYSFLSKWYMMAIYVLVGTENFQSDIEWIVRKLKNRVSLKQVEEALRALESLHMIKKQDSSFIQAVGAFDTDDDTRSVAVYRYHEQMIALGQSALRTCKISEREMNGVTIPVAKEKLGLLKEKIRSFRNEINELASSFENAEDVYQVNIQLFPLTEVDEK